MEGKSGTARRSWQARRPLILSGDQARIALFASIHILERAKVDCGRGPLMHLKAYAIDGALLRTGSANFSTSGENAQDNDLVVIREPSAAAKFEAHFERMWDAAQPMIEFEPAIKALKS
jgi:phosphatidylserine/phosphatidylglycerophosphate/cardiolipin synthase-like enzyme